MILILTSEAGDFSHPNFINWLEYYSANYFILSGEGIHNGRYDVVLENDNLIIDGINFSKEISVVLNRRFLTVDKIPNFTDRDKKLNDGLKKRVSSELYEFRNFLPYLNKACWIPNRESVNVNKINVLRKAKSLNLNVPDYIITNSKKKLINFKGTYNKIITKAIGNFQPTYTKERNIVNPIYTKTVSEELINQLPENFALSFFQKMILKSREYRILYFMGLFFSVELLSQENEHTLIDSRAQNAKKENLRLINTEVSMDIKKKLKNLMDDLDLNIGCIDLLKGVDGQFYFLEVNPVGQIAGYSTRANLNFEKIIVEKMLDIDKNGNDKLRGKDK